VNLPCFGVNVIFTDGRLVVPQAIFRPRHVTRSRAQ